MYGVIGIPVKKDSLDSFEHSILLSVINECALAMENSQNAIEKEKNAILAKNEQLRADLLRQFPMICVPRCVPSMAMPICC